METTSRFQGAPVHVGAQPMLAVRSISDALAASDDATPDLSTHGATPDVPTHDVVCDLRVLNVHLHGAPIHGHSG
jgi:hypothetical protein